MLTSVPWRIIRTLIISFFLSLLMLTGLSFLLYRFRLAESQITIGIYAIYLVSCLSGGFLIGLSMKSRRLLWGILIGGLYFLFLFAMSVLSEQGISSDISQILTILLFCIGGGAVGGILS